MSESIADRFKRSSEELRLTTFRMKSRRVKVPPPGTMLLIRHIAYVMLVTSTSEYVSQFLKKGTMLLVVGHRFVSSTTDHVEMFVVVPSTGAVWVTGAHDPKEIKGIFDVVLPPTEADEIQPW